MQLFALCAQLILCTSFLQAMDDKIQISSAQLSKPKVRLFLKTEDGETFLMRSERAKLLDWITQELEKDQNKGTENNPLIIPVTDEQIRSMDKFLEYVQDNDFETLRVNELQRRSVLYLADVIKTSWKLNCTPVGNLATKVFIQKVKDKHLKDFAEQSEFIDSFGFPAEITKSLGSLLLSAEDKSNLRSLLFTPLAEKNVSKQLVFNLSSDYLIAYGATPDNKGFCTIWCVHTGAKVASIMANSPINNGAFLMTPLLATLSEESCALWDVISGDPRLKQDNSVATKFGTMSVSPDLSILAWSVGADILLKDLKSKITKTLSQKEECKDLGQSTRLLFTPDSSVLIDLRSTGMIRFWHVRSGMCTSMEEHKRPIVKFHCSNYNVLTTVDQDATLCSWDCNTNKLLRRLDNLQRALCFNTQGDKLAFAEGDGTEGSVLDIGKNELSAKKFKINDGIFMDGCFHPGDKVLATSSSNNDICLWDPQQATLLARLKTENPVSLLSFSADGNILASTDASGKICLWHYCNKDIEEYLKESSLSRGLLLFLIIDAKRKGLSLDFINTPHLKAIYKSLDVDLLARYLK